MTICKDWNLSIDLKLPNRSTTEWINIFSLYAYENTGQLGKRILAVSIRPDKSYVWLMVDIVFKHQLFKYNKKKKVNAGNWVSLKISEKNGLHEVKIDYKLVHNSTNFTPKVWTNVNLVTGNTFGKENISTIGYYRNFKLKTCKRTGNNTKK